MSTELNQAGFEYAKKLIQDGHVVLDKQGDWDSLMPDAEAENEFIRAHGVKAYGQWHLGIRKGGSWEDKSTYDFPYGNFENVYRSGLEAAEERAAEWHYEEIRQAARDLLDMLPNQ